MIRHIANPLTLPLNLVQLRLVRGLATRLSSSRGAILAVLGRFRTLLALGWLEIVLGKEMKLGLVLVGWVQTG